MPEDIEDVSQKYQAFLGVEYEADTIKKVYIRSTDGTIEKECRQRAFHTRNVQRALFLPACFAAAASARRAARSSYLSHMGSVTASTATRQNWMAHTAP